MVITLKEIYRGVALNTPIHIDNFDVGEVIRHINESYVQIRNKYIDEGRPKEFAISQIIDNFDPSDFPYFNSTTLDEPLSHGMPLQKAIVSNVVQIYEELDEGIDPGDTFFREDVREYYPLNNLKYFEGDVVQDPKDGHMYKATETVVIDFDEPLEDRDEWTRVNFMVRNEGDYNAEIVDYQFEDRHKTIIDTGMPVITGIQDTLFASKDIDKIKIWYIPEHVDKKNFDDEFLMPQRAVKPLRNMVISELVKQIPTQNTQEDESEAERDTG